MWEAVAIALITHIGKKAIDEFWSFRDSSKSPVVNQTGLISYASQDASGRTVVQKDYAGVKRQQSGTLFGNFYLPESIQDLIEGDEIVLVLVVGADNEQTYLFEADITHGYEIDLPFGFYTVFVFVIDPEADDLFDAEIFAVGFPTAEHIDLTGTDAFTLQDYDDIWDFVDLAPVKITRGGPFYLDFILFDTEVETDLPVSFSELFEEEEEEFGLVCEKCGTHISSIQCLCGATISELTCNSCSAQIPLSDSCPICFADIDSIRCARCHRTISAVNCPGCGEVVLI